jgi:hypothetical protein
MFFLGILAIFQILFFPGLIFRAIYHPKGKFFFQCSVVVTISMLVNFLLFYTMVFLHIYTRTAVFIVIGFEVVALLWLYRGMFRTRLDDLAGRLRLFGEEVKESAAAWFKSDEKSPAVRLLRSLGIALILALALVLAFWFLERIWKNAGSVFNSWDSVVSWNAWAEVWAQNMVPKVHLTYPQLLPINLSLTYILIGNYQVSLFAKAVMPIFALLTALTILELAFTEKKYGYLIAVGLIFILYKHFLGEFISEGYADIPVAFMAFIALVPYLRNEDLLADKKEFILSIVLAAAAGLMKQVGLYMLVLLPLMAYLNSRAKSKKLVSFALIVLAGGVLLVLPWYLPRGIDVLQGIKGSGLDTYLTHSSQVQNTSNPFLRPVLAMFSLGKYALLYVFSLAAIPLLQRRWRWLIVLFLIPFTLLWGVIASYSTRNLSLTFPVLALVCGLGLQVVLDWVCRMLDRIKLGRLSAAFLILLALAPIVFYGIKLNDAAVIARWEKKQSQIFSPSLNEQLYALQFTGGCNSIVTNYPLNVLPGLEGHQINSYLNDYPSYQKYIADPSVCWLLVPGDSVTKEIRQDIKAKLADGTYTLLYDTKEWVPYQLIKIR